MKPAWALFKEDILVKSNAVFSGVVDDKWSGAVASVSLTFRFLNFPWFRLGTNIVRVPVEHSV